MKDLVLFLAECQATGTDLYIRTMGMDTTTPMGRVMFHVAGAFAEAERAMIIERVRAGLARTKATGRNKAGRPVKIGRPRVDPSLAPKVKAMKAAGMGINAIAKALKIGNGAVSRFLKA
jgi:DNA invertase Pin-like site-specific DNA recombinase